MTTLATARTGAAAPDRAGLAFLSLMASGVVWGLSWLPLKYFAAAGLGGHAIGLTAYSLVAVVSLPFIWRERAAWRAELPQLVCIGLFFGCANMAFTTALTMGSVVRAMLLFYLLPVWGAIGGALFLGKRIGPRRLAAVALSLGGVFAILGGFDALRAPLSTADLMALAAGLCYAAASVANRKARSIPLASRTLVSFSGCTVAALCALPFSDPAIPSLPPATWGWLIGFAFVWLLGGTLLTTYGVTHVQASRAAVLQVVELLVAVFSAVWIGGEPLGAREWTGGALIALATLVEAHNVDDNRGKEAHG
jgi:drug/metabolite transporter (DMT)-like permease